MPGWRALAEGRSLHHLGFSAGSPGVAPPSGREGGGALGVGVDLKARQAVGQEEWGLAAGRARSSARRVGARFRLLLVRGSGQGWGSGRGGGVSVRGGSRSCRFWPLGQGSELPSALRRVVPFFWSRLPAAACSFPPWPAVRARVAAFPHRAVFSEPERATSGPYGNLSVPREAGAKG